MYPLCSYNIDLTRHAFLDRTVTSRNVGIGFLCPVVLRRYSAEFSAPGIILRRWSNGATGYPRACETRLASLCLGL
jgi:hypothetical protein